MPSVWWVLGDPDSGPNAEAHEETNAAPAPQARRAASSHRVLVVDDDSDVRTMLRTQLEIEGYDVAEAVDGNEAWTIIQREHPAIVVADVQMPGRTGLELCKLARAAGFDTTGFIAFTAGMASWEECQDAGFDAHFLKTDPLPSLIQTIRRLLSR